MAICSRRKFLKSGLALGAMPLFAAGGKATDWVTLGKSNVKVTRLALWQRSTCLTWCGDEQAGWKGIFPELVMFDCHACHKLMSGNQWGPRPGTGLGPGVVRLNDANMLMFRHVLAPVDKAAASRIGEQIRALHRATTESRSATMAGAARLRASIEYLLPTVSAFNYGPESLDVILSSIQADAERGEYRDYASAEQVAMAAQSVVVAFENDGKADRLEALAPEKAITVQRAVDEMDADDYDTARKVWEKAHREALREEKKRDAQRDKIELKFFEDQQKAEGSSDYRKSPKPLKSLEERWAEKGLSPAEDPVLPPEPTKPPRYDFIRGEPLRAKDQFNDLVRQTEEPDKPPVKQASTGSRVAFRVVGRYLAFSTCKG